MLSYQRKSTNYYVCHTVIYEKNVTHFKWISGVTIFHIMNYKQNNLNEYLLFACT